jgi:hypothetical protein
MLEILEHAGYVDWSGLSQTDVIDLKLDGTKAADLYRMLLMAQGNALPAAMLCGQTVDGDVSTRAA